MLIFFVSVLLAYWFTLLDSGNRSLKTKTEAVYSPPIFDSFPSLQTMFKYMNLTQKAKFSFTRINSLLKKHIALYETKKSKQVLIGMWRWERLRKSNHSFSWSWSLIKSFDLVNSSWFK